MIKRLDTDIDVQSLLETLEFPAILLAADYQVISGNQRYVDSFGALSGGERCFQISHGYDRPCDEAGESCPLAACKQSGRKERVLHIHNSPRGREHIDVEMLPLRDHSGELKYFIEILKPVHVASARSHARQMVGQGPAFNRMVEMINRVAPHETSVLLQGESGTGKELAAAAIHDASHRSDKAMVTVECAGLTEPLFESELFGHVKGAFTGAVNNKPGLLEAAHGGSLFLDEIGDVPLGMQVKLLRLLETGTYRPVGSTQLKRADFRLISATHKNLGEMLTAGEFRRDLFFRINTFPIHLPALRERLEDLELLVQALLQRISPLRQLRISHQAFQQLKQWPFDGNVRELRNILERASIFSDHTLIDASAMEQSLVVSSAPKALGEHAWVDLETQEGRYLRRLLEHCDGDKARAAEIAGISVRSLYRRLEAAG